MLAFGEVQTGLLQNSRAVTGLRAAEVVNLVNGEQVRRLERPIAYAVSPDRPDGVDCRLPTGSGAHVRAIGTLITHAALVGGHVLQGSAYGYVEPGTADRRLPWPHYLTRPGRLEWIGKARADDIGAGLLSGARDSAVLDLPAITGRILDEVQRSPLLDHNPPLRAPRLRLRWTAKIGGERLAAAFAVRSEELRTFEISLPSTDVRHPGQQFEHGLHDATHAVAGVFTQIDRTEQPHWQCHGHRDQRHERCAGDQREHAEARHREQRRPLGARQKFDNGHFPEKRHRLDREHEDDADRRADREQGAQEEDPLDDELEPL